MIGFAQVNNFRVPTSYPGYFPDAPEGGDDIVESTGDGGSLAGVFRLFGPLDPLMNDRPWADITTIYWMMFHAVMTIITYALLPRISTVSKTASPARVVGYYDTHSIANLVVASKCHVLLLWLLDDSCFSHAYFSNAPSSVLAFLFVVQTIPASVAAVSISTILEYVLVRPLGFETYTVNDYGSIQQNRALLPVWIKSESGFDTTLPALDTKLLGEIVLTSFFTAFIGLFESLLTMQIIDELTYVEVKL